ncbi:unnamed protein product [Ceratitis capitata]|uniref:(Mediterranean fruit fly) hypothetical protein n=1 Tax=Ceratitis capitata TaxID=7213 RepID=A0A811V6L8_CERCA|nr:unnamed protein product [Ceratitis capitata]
MARTLSSLEYTDNVDDAAAGGAHISKVLKYNKLAFETFGKNYVFFGPFWCTNTLGVFEHMWVSNVK